MLSGNWYLYKTGTFDSYLLKNNLTSIRLLKGNLVDPISSAVLKYLNFYLYNSYIEV